MEQFQLNPKQKERLTGQVQEVAVAAEDLELKAGNEQLTLLKLKILKRRLENLKKDSDIFELKYRLETRRELGKRYNAKFVGEFKDGIAIVKDQEGKEFFINEAGKDICKGERFDNSEQLINDKLPGFTEGVAKVKKYGKWYFIDKEGNDICNGQRFINAAEFSDGLAMVRQEDEGWYFINKQGEDICNGHRFDDAGVFSEGAVRVKKDGKWYLINKQGQEFFPGERFDDIGDFSEGVIRVKKNGVWRFIDKQGNNIFNDKFFINPVSDFHEGLAFVKDSNNKYYFINRQGEVVFDGQNYGKRFDDVYYDGFKKGFVIVKKSLKWYLINKLGKDIFNGEGFDEIEIFSENVIGIQKNGKWYLINEKGDKLLNGGCFDNVVYDGLGFIRVYKKDEGWYFMNKEGKDIFKGQRFVWAKKFKEGIAKVNKNGKEFYIDIHGNRIFN